MSETGIDVANHLWVAVCGSAYAQIVLKLKEQCRREFIGHASTPEPLATRARVRAMLEAMAIADEAMEVRVLALEVERRSDSDGRSRRGIEAR
jgi:hypothetical protein